MRTVAELGFDKGKKREASTYRRSISTALSIILKIKNGSNFKY